MKNPVCSWPVAGSLGGAAVLAALLAPATALALHELGMVSDLLARDWFLPALVLGLAGGALLPWLYVRRTRQTHAYLLAREGGHWVRHAVAGDVVGIGRHPQNAIEIADRSLSRFHAEIVRHADDSFTITDLGSKNGMRVRFQPARTAPLRDGDLIELGSVRFRFALAPVDERLLDDTQTLEARRLWPERERRASPREAAHGHAMVRGEDSTCVMGEVRDVSDSGLFVNAVAPPAEHTPVQVAVEIEKGHWHTLAGEVVRKTGDGVGIHLSDPAKAEVLHRLRDTPAAPAPIAPEKDKS
jgi:predicted component of type VI protein secretion system